MSQKQAKIFVVDDDPSVLRSLERMLRLAGYEVEALSHPRQLLERQPVREPGCVVLDLRMPELNGLELQQELRKAGWELPIVFISGHGDIPSAVQAMKAGALDFLPKPFTAQSLLAAVGHALEGYTAARTARAAQEALRERFSQLSPREWEVCRLVARGLLNKQIASELGIAEQTVKVHRGHLMEKIGVGSVAELVALLARLGER